jgi:hypothetical protein
LGVGFQFNIELALEWRYSENAWTNRTTIPNDGCLRQGILTRYSASTFPMTAMARDYGDVGDPLNPCPS